MDHLLTEGYTVHVHHFFEMAKMRKCALISIDQIADLDTIVLSLCPMQLYL